MKRSLVFFLFISICTNNIVIDDAYAKKSPLGGLKKMVGKKKNPLTKLMKAMMQMPLLMEAFAKATLATTKTIMKTRKVMSTPMPTPEPLMAVQMELNQNLEMFVNVITQFRMNAAYKALQTINKECGSPVMSAAMSAPYVGTAVAGMCGKIATIDLKINSMLFQAEATLANGHTINDKLQEKAMMMQAGVGGMMSPGGMMGMAPGGAMMAAGGAPGGMPMGGAGMMPLPIPGMMGVPTMMPGAMPGQQSPGMAMPISGGKKKGGGAAAAGGKKNNVPGKPIKTAANDEEDDGPDEGDEGK